MSEKKVHYSLLERMFKDSEPKDGKGARPVVLFAEMTEEEERQPRVKGFMEDDHPEEAEEAAKHYSFMESVFKDGQRKNHKEVSEVNMKERKYPDMSTLQLSVSGRSFFSRRVTQKYKPSLLSFDMQRRELIFASNARQLQSKPTRVKFVDIRKIETNNTEDSFGFTIHLFDSYGSSGLDLLEPKIEFKTETAEEAAEQVERLTANVFLITTIYTVGKNGDYPETLLGVHTDTAICFSGGGSRAHVCASGQLRGLHAIGVLQDKSVNYMGATSGGAWATTIFTYYEKGARNDDELLGEVSDPTELTMQVLGQKPCPILLPANTVMWQEMKRIFWSTSSPELWETILGNIYLEPFGLNLEAPFAMRELVSTIRDYNAALSRAKIHQTRPHRPFLVLHANMIGPEWGTTSENVVVPIQFTGMYCGTPNLRDVTYKQLKSHDSFRKGQYKIGGGFIDTFAFGAELKNTKDANKIITHTTSLLPVFQNIGKHLKNLKTEAKEMLYKRQETGKMLKHFLRIPAPDKPFTLRHALGITSDGPALMFKNKAFKDQLNPRGHYFSPVASLQKGGRELDLVMEFGDGGVTDNLAIMPMLQRKVKRIIVFHNSEVTLEKLAEKDTDHIHYEKLCHYWPTTNILPLFGVPFDKKTAQSSMTKYFKNMDENKVFARPGIRDLLKGMLAKRWAGEPLVHVQKYTVLKNDFWDIEGGWEVEIMWFFLEETKKFNEQLPEEVQAEISKGYKGGLGGFPNFKTFGQRAEYNIDPSLTYEQINLLAAHTAWNVTQSADDIKRFLAGEMDIQLEIPEEVRHRDAVSETVAKVEGEF